MAFNKLQRACCKLSLLGKAAVRVVAPPSDVLTAAAVELDFPCPKRAGGAPVTIDAARLEASLRMRYHGHAWAPGQMMVVEAQGGKFTATVKEVEGAAVGVVSEGTRLQFSRAPGRGNLILMEGHCAPVPRTVMSWSACGFAPPSGPDASSTVFLRAFASRLFPATFLQRFGVQHVKGILVHGAPGAALALVTRQLAPLLNCAQPVHAAGAGLGSSADVWELCAGAGREWRERGAASGLHMIVVEGFEDVKGGVLSELLSKMEALGNVLVVAATNTASLAHLDPSLLAPGRFEVQIEVNPGTAVDAGHGPLPGPPLALQKAAVLAELLQGEHKLRSIESKHARPPRPVESTAKAAVLAELRRGKYILRKTPCSAAAKPAPLLMRAALLAEVRRGRRLNKVAPAPSAHSLRAAVLAELVRGRYSLKQVAPPVPSSPSPRAAVLAELLRGEYKLKFMTDDGPFHASGLPSPPLSCSTPAGSVASEWEDVWAARNGYAEGHADGSSAASSASEGDADSWIKL
eukprot:TRINITY_DN372_c0_g1_i3.p1 TRINITY_DN372_c0_g1~~TRINITY_DN372_c0_g1_i3.p1  ORF type:complete len:606 (+),score=191.78 TRINITY_DN372_c0_g1_i3:262-1818(+)